VTNRDITSENQFFHNGVLYTSTRYIVDRKIEGELICATGINPDFNQIVTMANTYIIMYDDHLKWIGYVTNDGSNLIFINDGSSDESELSTCNRLKNEKNDLALFINEWWAKDSV
jgi:hypothetical protein